MTAADASSLARWEWIETIGWLAVIVGCFGEGIAEFTKWPKDDEKRHKLGKMSWLILIAGLGLEFWGSGRVAAIKDLEVARLNKEAGDATRLAGEATKLAAELNVRATSNELARVELQKQVEVLRKANLDHRLKYNHAQYRRRCGRRC